MRSRRRVIGVIVAVAVAVVAVAILWKRSLTLPELGRSGPVVAFRIDEEASADQALEILHERWPAVQRVMLAEPVQSDVLGVLHDPGNLRKGSVRCFSPGMAFRVGSGRDAEDVLVCLKCDNIYYYGVGEGQAYKHLRLTPAGHAAFARIYQELFGPPVERAATTTATTRIAPTVAGREVNPAGSGG
jgi:hypothetical protein